jgi:hypothetical protein
MNDEISTKIQQLPDLRKAELSTLWQELFVQPPHPKLRRELMIPILAYRLQENAYGGLKFSTRKRLGTLAKDVIGSRVPPLLAARQLRRGTKLLRQWQGGLHEVMVLDDGFRFQDKRYGSLSEIARKITGTRWSGPAFFGLKKKTAQKATGR